MSIDPEQDKIREALWRNEAQLAFALEIAGGVGTWDWDLKTDLIYCNERFANLFSVDPVAAKHGVPSMDYIAAIHPDDQPLVVERTQNAIAAAGPYVVEFRLPQKHGADLWIYALGHAYRDTEGNPVRFPGAAMDITQRKEVEAELKIAHHRAQNILESITDGFLTLDRNFCFIYMNPAAEQMLAARREDLLGKSLWKAYPETVGTGLEQEYLRAVHDHVPASFEWLFEEWQRWFAIRAYPTDEGGLSVYFRDISEQKRVENLERERQEHLRERARLESLGLMAGGIAHDFNNLLTGILGNASLLAQGASGRAAVFAEQIIGAAERAAALTKQMLDYSGHGFFVATSIDLNAHIRDNLTLLLASLPTRSVSIELQLGPGDCIIEAATTQIQQVLMNLLLNAVEAAGDGPGKVLIRTDFIQHRPSRISPHLCSTVAAGNYVALEIHDSGTGMTPETVRKIFDPFFSTKFTGRGLGLASVIGIVRGYSGDIEVVSEPGTSTIFRILFPAFERTVARSIASTDLPVPQVSDQKILIVDDEEMIRTLATSALRSWGMEVVVAGNGAEAIDILTAEPKISVVILDLTMPVMTGEEALPLIKSIRPDLPIIISSGFSEAEIAHRFAASGIAGVLSKPYSVAIMLSKVSNALQVNDKPHA